MLLSKKHWIWKTRLLAALWWLVQIVHAQQPFQHKYTIENGLPHSEVDQIAFAENGDLWIKYSNLEYLSHFDGNNWTHYNLSELGLPLGLFCTLENKHRLWFSTWSDDYLQLVCYTKNKEWKTYRLPGFYYFSKQTKSGDIKPVDKDLFTYAFDPKSDSFVRSLKPLYTPANAMEEKVVGIYFLKEETAVIAIATDQGNKIKYRFGENFEKTFFPPDPSFTLIYCNTEEVRGIYTINNKFFFYSKNQNQPIDVYLPTGRKGQIISIAYLSFIDQVFLNNYPNGLVVKDPKTEILYLYALDSLGHTQLLLSHLQKGYFLGSFAQDKLGNWWYGTSTGVVRTNQALLTFNEADPNMVTSLHCIGESTNGNIWMGGYTGQGGFSIFDGNELRRHTFSTSAMAILPGSLKSNSGTLYFFDSNINGGIIAIKDGHFHRLSIHPSNNIITGFYFLQLSNDKIGLGLGTFGLGIAEETDGLISSVHLIGKEKGMLLDNVLTISEDLNGRIWMGRYSQGVALYDPQRDTAITWLRSTENPKSIGAMSSCIDEEGTLWLGTNKGLYLLPQAQHFDYQKDDLFGLIEKITLPGQDSSMVTFLKNTKDYLVAGTQFGVYFLDKKYARKRTRIFALLYGKDIAGSGSEQNAVLLDSKGFLWVGTQEGATRIDLQNLHFDTSTTEITLRTFHAGDLQIPVNKNKIGKIPADKRNIRFSFSASGNEFLEDHLFFDITIKNNTENVLFQQFSTRNKNIEIAYLPKGDYILHLSAFKNNILAGTTAYHFEIPALLDENPLFWSGLATLVAAIPFLWFWFQNRQQKLVLQHQVVLEKSTRERDSLKIQALSNFFNPHFINNVLHWVQSKYRKDPETTMIMGRLAENVDILYKNTQAGKVFHSLDQELELVKNYLKIQQVRFGNILSIQLSLPENPALFNTVKVPSLLLQIFVENAIEKGIRKRKGASRFVLDIIPFEDGFKITIEDDGRGRPTEKMEQETKRNGSTAVMNSLIELLNLYNTDHITIDYEDNIFNTPEAGQHGTRVHIYIPKNYNYEFS